MPHIHTSSEDSLPPLPQSIDLSVSGVQPGASRVGNPSDRPSPLPGQPVIEFPGNPAIDPGIVAGRIRTLKQGCYLLHFSPAGNANFSYYGTMRIERNGTNTTASGDLYQHNNFRFIFKRFPNFGIQTIVNSGPNPANGIPIFTRANYRYYVRVTQLLEFLTTGNAFTLGFQLHKYNAATAAWSLEGSRTALMRWVPAPAGYPDSNHYLSGEVKDARGTIVGTLTMGWVSKHLRKATIEIDRVRDAESPLNNGSGTDWQDIFDQVGWHIEVKTSDTNLGQPSGVSWSDAEMHAAMLKNRDIKSLDREWRYHLLCVRRLDSTSRGIMYDAFATDSNKVPREGAAIASHWTIPNTNQWGLVKGMRFGLATAPYFRTAVHELGHAMGLYHNIADTGFMNTTGAIASSATAATPFPNNILWSFNGEDQRRLRHMPDMWVRPGGKAFGSQFSVAPISPLDEATAEPDGLELQLTMVNRVLPIGAPARINVALVNKSDMPQPGPTSLSLKQGFVSGAVIDPAGTERTFLPLILCMDEDDLDLIEVGDQRAHSVTLLRGGQGALFPLPGLYTIVIDARWTMDGIPYKVSGEVQTMVTGPEDDAHAEAAMDILTTPDAMLALVLNGDHLTEGNHAIQSALDNSVLRPHYAYIEAKRLLQRQGDRKPDPTSASKLLNETTVMNPAEIRRATKLVKAAEKDASKASMQRLKKCLTIQASIDSVDTETKKMVDEL